MLTMKTIEGKEIKITRGYIEISKNHLIEGGYFFDVNLTGILPGCRKKEKLTYMYSPETLNFTTLFNYRKYHGVDAEEYRKLLRTLPVWNPTYLNQHLEITEELEKKARIYVEGACDCYAVKGQ